ncbi:MAG: hypothetical protein JRI23_03425 [Deltaproteobacteria bacterium]|jgi:hypothetical protein|nr:hypothetical protein [Deltaproteobacteria bacterium]MBW2530561.1 hypothetical protein [Deltaproteobacteria bacterium]
MRLSGRVALLIGLLAMAPPALAAPSAAEKETARSLVRKGNALEKSGDLPAAVEAYRAAHDIMGVPTTGLKLAKAQQELGQLVEALDTLLAIHRIPKERYEPRAFRQARKEATKLAEKLSPRIPSVQVELAGDAAEGAEVLIDGEPMRAESIGVPFKVNPGSHVIEATRGELDHRVEIELDEGDTRVVKLKLETPPEPVVLAPPERDDTTALVLTAVGFGVAGAGGIVGAVTGALSTDQATEVATSCPGGACPPETHEDLDSATTLGHVSTAMFVTAAAGAVVGTIGLAMLLSDDAPPQEATALVLTPGGLSIRGVLP